MLALIKGTQRLISVEECVAKYGNEPENKGVEPVCYECGSKFFIHAPSSIKVPTRFQHGPNKSCNIAKYSDYFKNGVMNVRNGQHIKETLRDEQYLKQLYSFCHKLFGGNNFSPEIFYDLLKIAKQKNVWYYHNIEPWNFAFVLLTLQDFTGHSQKNGSLKSYTFRFYLTDNVDPQHLNSLNNEKHSITKKLEAKSNLFGINLFLAKVFGNGNLMKFPDGNPYKVCKSTWDKFNKEYITTEIIKELKGKINLLIGK